jgi:TP901 family phage tail tape measure protein
VVNIGSIYGTLELIDRFSPGLEKAGNNLQKAGQRLRALGTTVSEAGSAMLPLSVGVAALGGYALKTFADFETGMNRVRAVTGAAGADFDAMRKQAAMLGATTVFTAGEAADAMGYLGLAGFKVNEILAAMPGVLQLASAAQLDVAAAADITAKTMRGYGLAVTEVGRINDVMTKAFTTSNTDLTQLGDAFRYAGPIANVAGMEFEEAAASLSLMADAGFQGTLGGTALRGAIARLAGAVPTVTRELQAMGVTTVDASGKLLPFVDILKQLEKEGLDTAEIMSLFGQRAGPAMAALLERGSEELEKFTQTLRDSGGTAERIAKIQLEGLRGAWVLLESATEGVALSLGEVLAPYATELMTSLTNLAGVVQTQLVPWLKSLSDTSKTALVAFLATVAIGGPLLLGLGSLIRLLGFAAGGFGAVATMAGRASLAVLDYATATKVAGDASVVASGKVAASSLSYARWMGVIGRLGPMLGRLGGAVAGLGGTVLGLAAGTGVVLTLSGAWGDLYRVVKGLLALQWTLFVGLWTKVGDAIGWAAGKLSSFAAAVRDTFQLQSLFDGVKGLVSGSADYLEGLNEQVKNFTGQGSAMPPVKSPLAAALADSIPPLRLAKDAMAEAALMAEALQEEQEKAAQITKEQAEAMARLHSSGTQLSESNRKLVADYIAMGKSQEDIAKAYGFTEQQVRDVAAAEEALVRHREHQREVTSQLLEDEAARAKEAMDTVATGAAQMLALRKESEERQVRMSGSALEYDLWAANEWLQAQEEKWDGATTQANEFYELQKRRGKEMRDDAVMADQEAQAARRNAAIVENFKKTSELQQVLADEQAARTMGSTDLQVREIERWAAETKAGYDTTLGNTKAFYDLVDRIAAGRMQDIRGSWEQLFASIPQMMMSAFSGGGNAGKTLGAGLLGGVGDIVGASLSKSIGGMLGKVIGSSMPIIGTAIGGLIGGAFDKAFGTAGRDAVKEFAASAGGFDALRSKLNDLGTTGERLWVNLTQGVGRNNPEQAAAAIANVKRALEFSASYGGYDKLREKLLAIGDAGGVLWNNLTNGIGSGSPQRAEQAIADVEAAFAALLQIQEDVSAELDTMTELTEAFGGVAPAALQPFIASLLESTRLTEEQRAILQGMAGDPSWEAIEAAAGRYEIKLEDLGGKYQQLKSNASFDQLFSDWTLLSDAGTDNEVIFDGMAGAIIEALQRAEKFGLEVPSYMRPLAEQLEASGRLVGENGDKLVDLGKLNWSDTLKSTLDTLVGVLERIAEILARDIPAAAAEADRAMGRVRPPALPDGTQGPDFSGETATDPWTNANQTDYSGNNMALGGSFRVHKPTVFVAGEAGPEDVAFSGANRAFGGERTSGSGGGIVVVNVGPRTIAELIVPEIPGVVLEYGLGGL